MTVESLLKALKSDELFKRNLVLHHVVQAREPVYGELETPLPGPLEALLSERGIRLYIHQAEAIEKVRRRRNIVLTSSTASGKTLAFLLPILEHLLANGDATALFLYPNKALSRDQERTFRQWADLVSDTISPACYDGDTPGKDRPEILKDSRIILSNPFALHHIILPKHPSWARFFANLSFVVIDEAHMDRGIFGSHVALVIRRLRRIAAYYGAHPVFICATATIANPVEFAENLVGVPFHHVASDGSPKGTKHVLLYAPARAKSRGEDVQVAPSLTAIDTGIAGLLLMFISHGLQTLCFTRSRKEAEILATRADELAEEEHSPARGRIAAYRAGYLPSERRSLERRLKSGELRGLISTNALEVGMDIGSLDGVILCGYPGTMMATWQQIGRAGRTAGDSIALIVAYPEPIDQYFVRTPRAFISAPQERAVISITNPLIARDHLLCGAQEVPLKIATPDPLTILPVMKPIRQIAIEEGVLTERNGVIPYTGTVRMANRVNLNGFAMDQFIFVSGDKKLGTFDRQQAYREAHPGAIYLHQTEPYEVTGFDPELRVITGRHLSRMPYLTVPHVSTTVRILSQEPPLEIGRGTIAHGEVMVTLSLTAYSTYIFEKLLETFPLDMPPIMYQTRAFWICWNAGDVLSGPSGVLGANPGMAGVQCALCRIVPFFVLCDRRDVGGAFDLCHPDTGLPTVFLYDAYPGGIGIAETAFGLVSDILSTTFSIVHDCTCGNGCPGCVLGPELRGSDVEPTRVDAQYHLSLLGVGTADAAEGDAPSAAIPGTTSDAEQAMLKAGIRDLEEVGLFDDCMDTTEEDETYDDRGEEAEAEEEEDVSQLVSRAGVAIDNREWEDALLILKEAMNICYGDNRLYDIWIDDIRDMIDYSELIQRKRIEEGMI